MNKLNLVNVKKKVSTKFGIRGMLIYNSVNKNMLIIKKNYSEE